MRQPKYSEEMKNEQKVYLYGASGHGKVVAEIAEAMGLQMGGFIDDNPQLEEIWGFPVYSSIPAEAVSVFYSVGNNLTRKKLVEKYHHHPSFNLIHPNSYLSTRTYLGCGNVIMAGVIINPDVKIGNHCIINTQSSIDHESVLEDYVHISPNVALAGNVKVKEGAHVGIGASVIQGITIGKWATVGAGAVVIEDVPDFAVVVGNPAKVIKIK